MYSMENCPGCGQQLPRDETEAAAMLQTEGMVDYVGFVENDNWYCPNSTMLNALQSIPCYFNFADVWNIEDTCWYDADEIADAREDRIKDVLDTALERMKVWVCCGSVGEECTCQRKPLSFSAGAALVEHQLGDLHNVYWDDEHDDLDCNGCRYVGTELCEPLCNKIYAMFINQDDGSELKPCKDYSLNPVKINTLKYKGLTRDMVFMKYNKNT